MIEVTPKMTVKTGLVYSFMFVVNHIIGIKSNKFFFEGVGGKYNDNARAVSEKLHAIHPEATIVWAIDKCNLNDSHIPNYIVKATNGLTRLYHRATSVGWISCIITSNIVYKSRQQRYVQCWHGDRPMKKILKDVCDMYIFETSHADAMTSGSTFYTGLIDSAFNFRGRVIESGCPRNDILLSVNHERYLAIKKDLCIDEEKKILLYAPTFRDSCISSQSENIDLSRVAALLEKNTSAKWVCLGRFHPAINKPSKFNSLGIIDVTSYYDMADLLLISDMIITDYSSSASDFSITGKPVFLYQPDRQTYVLKDRELYYDIDKSPFWVAKSQEDLEKLIIDKTELDSKENSKEIDEFYGTHESGHASEDVVNFLYSK